MPVFSTARIAPGATIATSSGMSTGSFGAPAFGRLLRCAGYHAVPCAASSSAVPVRAAMTGAAPRLLGDGQRDALVERTGVERHLALVGTAGDADALQIDLVGAGGLIQPVDQAADAPRPFDHRARVLVRVHREVRAPAARNIE